MGATQVAEGPLIKHVPGGFAEWRAKESGLPPARLHSSEGEWWGKLVGPTDATDPDPIKVDPPDPIVKPDDSTDELPNFSDYSIAEKFYIKPPHVIDWSQPDIPGYTDAIKAIGTPNYGWGDPPASDDPSVIEQWKGFRRIEQPTKPESPKTLVPGGQADRLTIGSRPPAQKGPRTFDPYKRDFTEAGSTVVDAITDVFKGVESMAEAVVGKTSLDKYPRPKNEKEVIRFSKKLKEWFEGFSEEEFLLWETEGVPGGSITGREPFGPKYGKTLANLGRIIKNEDKIEIQEMGSLQWLAIMNAVKLFEMYGPLGAAFPLAATIAKDTANALNAAFSEHPILAGNPAQDIIYGTVRIPAKILQKTYNATIGKILPKIEDSNIKDKISNLNIFDYTAEPPAVSTFKVDDSYKHIPPDAPPPGRINPPQHDRGPKGGQENLDPEFYSDGEFVPPPPVGQTPSPGIIQGQQPQQPQGQQGQTEIFGGKSPEQMQVTDTKTIVPQPYQGLSPAGYANEPIPTSQREVWGGDYPRPIEEINLRQYKETFGGPSPTQKAPTGISIKDWIEKHGDGGHVTPPKGEPIDGEVKEPVYDEIEAQAPPNLPMPLVPLDKDTLQAKTEQLDKKIQEAFEEAAFEEFKNSWDKGAHSEEFYPWMANLWVGKDLSHYGLGNPATKLDSIRMAVSFSQHDMGAEAFESFSNRVNDQMGKAFNDLAFEGVDLNNLAGANVGDLSFPTQVWDNLALQPTYAGTLNVGDVQPNELVIKLQSYPIPTFDSANAPITTGAPVPEFLTLPQALAALGDQLKDDPPARNEALQTMTGLTLPEIKLGEGVGITDPWGNFPGTPGYVPLLIRMPEPLIIGPINAPPGG